MKCSMETFSHGKYWYNFRISFFHFLSPLPLTFFASYECTYNHKGHLTLQKLWFYVQPSLHTLETLSAIITSINRASYFSCTHAITSFLDSVFFEMDLCFYPECLFSSFSPILILCFYSGMQGRCEGGALLSLLHERTMCALGDAATQDLCMSLTQAVRGASGGRKREMQKGTLCCMDGCRLHSQSSSFPIKACVPYFSMLEKWIFHGLVEDPYGEFMVAEEASM